RAVNFRYIIMPALQTSSAALALSSSSIVVIVIFLLLVLGGSAGYFFVVPCVRRAVKERRARTKDVENSTSILIRYPLEKVKKAAAAAVLAKARARLPITMKRSVSVAPSARKVPGRIKACRQLSRLAESSDSSTRFGASRTRTRPGPSTLRAVTLAPEPAVAAAALDLKKADAASHLVTARIRLAVNAKKAGAVIGQSPFGAVRKTVVTTRPYLQSLTVGEVRTRFGIHTRGAMPGPSPLRRVFATLQSESITESTTNVDPPTIVHAIADFLSAVYDDADDDVRANFSTSDSIDENLCEGVSFSCDLGCVVPVDRSVFDVPTILVESPSGGVGVGVEVSSGGDENGNEKVEVQVPEPRAPHKRGRSGTFIGWRAGMAQSRGKALGSTNAGGGGGKGSSSTGTGSEKSMSSGSGKDKENKMAFLRVPPRSPPRPLPSSSRRRA
ncbi:hypothetical protein K438DRAFT_1847800, partial [Mycena galopus ATCC 62051]